MKLAELREAIAKHDSLGENERLLDDPPTWQIPRTCLHCGREWAFEPGWEEVRWWVNVNQEPPATLDSRGCEDCEATDAD